MPELKDCKSSNVSACGYDPATGELHVRYKSGGTYVYTGVPSELGSIIHDQESVGKFLHGKIRPNYVGRKLDEPK